MLKKRRSRKGAWERDRESERGRKSQGKEGRKGGRKGGRKEKGRDRERKKKKRKGLPIVAQWVKNPFSIHEEVSSIPGHAHRLRIHCGVCHRCSLDSMLPWL